MIRQNKITVKTLAIHLVMICGICSTSWSLEPDVTQKADQIIRNWKSIDVRTLRDPANAEAIKKLKKEAHQSSRSDVRVPLLRLGDKDTTDLCLADYRSPHSFERGQAARQLAESANAGIIQLVADDLFRNESTQTVFVAPEFRLKPISVHAGEIIRALVSAAPDFNAATKQWVASLSRQSGDQREAVRDEMRRWWSENRPLITAGRYAEVQPPSQSRFPN